MKNFLIGKHELEEIKKDLMSFNFSSVSISQNNEMMNSSCGNWGCGYGCQGDCDGSCKDWGCESGNDGR